MNYLRMNAGAAIALIIGALVPGLGGARAEVPSATIMARTSPAGNYLAGRHAGAARDMAAASSYYRAVLRADPKNEELLERAFLSMVANGAIEDAMPYAERLVGIDRTHRIARLTLAMRAIKRGQYPAARTHLAQSVRGPIADLTAALIIAWAHAGANESKAAVDGLGKLQGPEWYGIFKDLHAGLILDLLGQKKEAGRRLERAYRADSTALRTVEAYGRWASRNGERDAAISVYTDFSKVLPRHPLIEGSLAELNAGRTLQPLVRNAPAGVAEVLYGLGSALGRQGGEDLGLVYLRLALYLEPEHPIALLALADLYESMKKPEAAIETYARVPANSPLKNNAEVHRSLNLDSLDRTEEARKNLEGLIAKNADDLEAIMALGNILRARKLYKEAAEVYSKAVARVASADRAHWTLFYFRGIAFERSKQWERAEIDFQKALELYPDQPQVLNYLGYSWVDQGRYLDKAIEMIRKAVALRPNDGYIVDSLGWAYYRLGQYDDAVRELERAIELRPEDPVINDHLGDAYWRVGRKLESFFQWRHARDLKPDPDDLTRIEVKLRDGLKEEDPASKAGSVSNRSNGG